MKTLLALSALLVGGVLLYRRLLLPWDTTNEPTIAEQRKAAYGGLTPRFRTTQPATPKPSPWWVRQQLKRHRSA